MSNLAAPHAAYRRGEVLAATPAQLVVLLYDGARRFLRQGASAMRDGEVERAHRALRRAERIVAHLDGTLDFEQGEVAQRLHVLYGFCLRHLNDARMSLDAGKVEEVGELLGELRDAFNQAAAEVQAG
ncbi:MAG TPA: flagellar export chaperone FliS [Solirubrobacteraceae bacterium]|nr:flagellar export chaperone FliS [Solirubrobacteraceae bacterium]